MPFHPDRSLHHRLGSHRPARAVQAFPARTERVSTPTTLGGAVHEVFHVRIVDPEAFVVPGDSASTTWMVVSASSMTVTSSCTGLPDHPGPQHHGSVHLHMDADVREIAAPNGEVRVNGRLWPTP